MDLAGDWVVVSLEVSSECRLEVLLLLSAVEVVVLLLIQRALLLLPDAALPFAPGRLLLAGPLGGPLGGPPPPAAFGLVCNGVHCAGYWAALDAAGACGPGAGGGGGGSGGGGRFRPRRPPGDCCCPGEPLPNVTPPGAVTALCLQAVDGRSSSALSGRTRLPFTHRAAVRGCWCSWSGGISVLPSSSGCWTACNGSVGRSWFICNEHSAEQFTSFITV